MKKIFAFFLVLTVLFGTVSCAKEQESGMNAEVKTLSQVTTTLWEKETKHENSEILPYTFRVPLEDIYIDIPAYQQSEKGHTELLAVHGSHYIAITEEIETAATNAQEVHEKMFEKFKTNMQMYEGGTNFLNITSEENIKINNIEVYCFEGTLNCGYISPKDFYAKGYAFVFEGTAIEIIGCVVDDNQPQSDIDTVENLLEEMVRSVRKEA